MSSEEKYPPILDGSSRWFDHRLFNQNFNQAATEAYVPKTVEEHRMRRDMAIRQVKLSAGLEPEIRFSKKSPRVMNRHVYEGVAIYDVDIETLPGLRLTGNLFMPEKADKPLPGILCPHGHWTNGRVHNDQRGGVSMRSFEFARLGFAVFSYDMIGHNDNNDLPHYFPTELKRSCDLNGVSTFGLQTANSLRAVDFLASLPEVNADLLGCTGASGGASQTWFIALLDRRIRAIAPVCMLSGHYQGGCPCEEGPLLRTRGLTSFDIVASLAPMPIILPSVTGDWTNLNPAYEIPRLKQVYALYGADKNVSSFYYDDLHNYNKRTREHVYAWFKRQLMDAEETQDRLPEEDIPAPAPEILWHNGKKPEPASEEKTAEAIRLITPVYTEPALDMPDGFQSWKFRNTDILRRMIGSDRPTENVVEREARRFQDMPFGQYDPHVVSRRGVGDIVAQVRFLPGKPTSDKRGFLIVTPESFHEFLGDGRFSGIVNELMKRGIPGMGIELLGSGETEKMLSISTRDNGEKTQYAFEHSLFSMRVQDIVTSVVLMRERGIPNVTLLAPAGTAPAALAAAALLGGMPLVADLAFAGESLWMEPLNYQPLIGKIGGLAGLALLNAEKSVTFCNVPDPLRKLLADHPCRLADGTWNEHVLSVF